MSFSSCASENQSFPLVQAIVFPSNDHTHEVLITKEELLQGKRSFETSETFGHRHQVDLKELDVILLLRGLQVEVETNEVLNHKHKLELRLFDF
ncbi:MAG: hypothetical protein NZ853_02190 [Leptospiraceae bacterium]|nr:hypothetical protein [Leptospiraceae bacterium]MDW7975964.1 hypothetical protein [Leptospiraceae bacterium]